MGFVIFRSFNDLSMKNVIFLKQANIVVESNYNPALLAGEKLMIYICSNKLNTDCLLDFCIHKHAVFAFIWLL